MSYKGTKWSDEKRLAWSKKCKETKVNTRHMINLSDEERKKLSTKSKEHNKKYWTEEKRKEQSIRMKDVVVKHSQSYSKNNVSGRAKLYDINSSDGLTKVKGSWELKVANWLNERKIKWTNNINPFKYHWNNNFHLYYPDFYLPDFDFFIEVKGYETERDRIKWRSVNKKLVVLKNNEINNLSVLELHIIHRGLEQ